MTDIRAQLELGTKVLEQIEQNPELHDNSSWFDPEGKCGTTRCVAGWTLHFAGWQMDETDILDPDGIARKRIALRWTDDEPWIPSSGSQYGELAADLLGLNEEEANEMFHSDDEEAVELLRDHIAALTAKARKLEEEA